VKGEFAFPFSTHSLFGDHEEQEKFDIFVNDEKITYDIALNKDLYSYKTENSDSSELYYKNDSIGNNKHDLLTNSEDLFAVAPSLYNDGFEMFAYWELEFQPEEKITVDIDFIHYSGFGCSGDCGHTGFSFIYNIIYSKYWPELIEFNVTVLNQYNATITTSLDVNLPGQKFICSGTDTSENFIVAIQRPDKIFNVNGKVFDSETNEPIDGAEVGVEYYEPVLTNETGFYSLKITEMGTWAIYASKEGYKNQTQTIDLYQEFNFMDFYLEREGNATAG
jgi:hypothetical protein